MKRLLLALALFAGWQTLAQAQIPVTLRANQTVADGRLVPVLTWTSSSAPDTNCVASGGWTGSKPSSGTQTLPEITASANYVLTCTGASTAGTASVSWTPPTANTDGSPLTNLASYDVVTGTSASALTRTVSVPAPASSAQITGLSSGTWFFGVYAVNANDARSAISNVTSKLVSVGAPTGTASVSITIRPVPNAPVLTTVAIVWNGTMVPVMRLYDSGAINTNPVGMVAVGRAVDEPVKPKWKKHTMCRIRVASQDMIQDGDDMTGLVVPCAGPQS